MADAARKDTGARGLAAAFKAEAESAVAEAERASAPPKPAAVNAGKKSDSTSDPANAAKGFGEGTAVLRGRIEIDLENRIPALDSFRASAFMAQDKGDPGRKIFALVCDPKVPIRGKPLDALRGRLHKNVLSVVVDGVISPKGVDQSRLAIVFDRPIERTLADLLAERQGRPLEERVLTNQILPQLLAALRELEEIGVTHRGIRPENIFYGDDSRETLVLGDFLTVPPGRMQPSIYEPIETAQAMPEGHGIGTGKSDVYALGVTMLSLLTGVDPRAQWEDAKLIAERLTNGSYTAIIKETRLPPAIQELLRGTMSDDLEERWDLDEIDGWIRGRRSSPERIVLSRRATQPMNFDGRAITHDLELVDAFFRNPVGPARSSERRSSKSG